MSRSQRNANAERMVRQSAQMQAADSNQSHPQIGSGTGERGPSVAGMAVRQRWPVPAEYRVEIVGEMHRLATGCDHKPRDKTRAAQVLVSMDKLNVDQEKMELGVDGAVRQNVNVSVNVQAGSLERFTDDELERFLRQTDSVARACRTTIEGAEAGSSLLSAPADGTTGGVSRDA